MIIQNNDDRLILICAFRYALGRVSYMPSVVAGEIKRQWNCLSNHDRQMFQDEIREAIHHGCAGMDSDVAVWMTILDLPAAGAKCNS